MNLIPENEKNENRVLMACVSPKKLYMKTHYPLLKMTVLKDDLGYIDNLCMSKGIKYTVVNGYYGVTTDHRALIRIGFRREDDRYFYGQVKNYEAHIVVTDAQADI